MNWLPSFVSWPLAAAGLACAAGPIIIHLLNRRRFRTVDWGAMEYLLQAMQRNRKILRLRDLLLLLLRTAAILLVGLGIAQPFFTSDRTSTFDGGEPLHAVLLIDNSQSMASQSLEGTLLDVAKRRAVEFVKQLPAGSRVTVAPLCGSTDGLSLDAFQSMDHAEDAIERLQVAAREAPMSGALNLARKAWEVEPQFAKRLVLLTDMQAVNWQRGQRWDEDKPLQVVTVRPGALENSWVEHVAIEDNVADVETPATVTATIRHGGSQPRENVQVTLKVDGQVAGVNSIDLLPGGTREVTFQHLFNAVRPEPGRPLDTLLEVSIPPDRLAADDRRSHVAHVVASLPVLFVDAWGDQESVSRGRIGETRQLRGLLAPESSESSLIKVRHLRPEQLDRNQLADARLVVMAGVAEPAAWTGVLLDYVKQGGQLFLAAGGQFQPQRWTELAYSEQATESLLPAPLLPELVGQLPSDAGQDLKPFFLDFDSLRTHEYFQIAGVGEELLRDLYGEPIFFQAVAVDRSRLSQADSNETLSNSDANPQPAADMTDSGGESTRWVAWPPKQQMKRSNAPRVLARYDRDQLPFLVERELGEGRVVFVTTGVLPEWSTLTRTNAVLLLDRILRSMIDSTLPTRNFAALERLDIPVPAGGRGVSWELQRPNEALTESLEPGFIGKNLRGLSIDRPLATGVYRLVGRNEDGSAQFNIPVAVECPPSESQLAEADVLELSAAMGSHVRFLRSDEPISLSGAQTRAHNMWWWLILAAMALLLGELMILAPWRVARADAGTSSHSSLPAATGGVA